MNNQKIRDAMRIADVKQWQVADALNVHEKTLSVWLRHELPKEKQAEILAAIKKVHNDER